MKIKLSLSRDGIKKAVAELRNYEKSLPDRCEDMLISLSRIGENNARGEYEATANYYDGSVSCEVTSEKYASNIYKVVARGNTAPFLEFGAGVYYNTPDPYPIPRPEGVSGIGEYGQGRGKNPWWLYRGDGGTESTAKPGMKITHGNPAGACMYHAGQFVRNYIEEAAKDAFEK